MGRYHEWKGRKDNLNEGYPHGNAPPYHKVSPEHESEFPVEAGLGSADRDGVTVVVAGVPGAGPATITFTGPATAAHGQRYEIQWTLTAANIRKRASVSYEVPNTATETAIATAVAAALNTAMGADGDVTSAAGVVTITLASAGTIHALTTHGANAGVLTVN